MLRKCLHLRMQLFKKFIHSAVSSAGETILQPALSTWSLCFACKMCFIYQLCAAYMVARLATLHELMVYIHTHTYCIYSESCL